ncbi:MAG: HAMP domain-containing protein [Acidobacteria bacterium]|nr:HAMP domain-containing protein [Acidobacteriota bacterium]MBI3487123.1 HAMP domain-containing protein [Acidobacteriota bacterium]
MLKLQIHSLKHRLTLLLACITGLTFLFSFTVLFLFERAELRRGQIRDLKTQALVLSQVVSADLDFGNLLDSNKSLQALSSNKHVLAARIFDANGQLFTSLVPKQNAAPLPEVAPDHEYAVFHEGVLDMFVRIYQEGQLKGTLFIRSDLEEMRAQFQTALKVMSAAGLGLLLLAIVASSVLQRQVSTPILSLAETAQRISHQRDFSIRLQSKGGGEIGVLSQSFNDMLDHIQARDAKLLAYQDHLKEEVIQRSEQLSQTEHLLSATLDALPACIAILDGEGTIQATNQRWKAFSSPVNRFIYGVKPGDDYKAICSGQTDMRLEGGSIGAALLQVLDGSVESSGMEYDFGEEEGRHWFTVLVSRFSTENAIYIVLMHLEVTEQKRMEIQLRQAQKLESIGQLTAGIAHEINTPTQYIGDNLVFLRQSFDTYQALMEQLQALLKHVEEGSASSFVPAIQQKIEKADLAFLQEETPVAINQCQEGVQRVTKIVRAMKDFSHPGSATKTPVDLNRAIETTTLVCRSEWKYMAELEMDLDPDLPLVPCLPDQINQVILNLVINAAHAIESALKDAQGEKGLIRVSTRSRGDFAEIRVQDSGTGIPEGIRSRIFDPFFTTKPVGKGTGQGLAIAYAIVVNQHGGTITVRSEVGKGSLFIVRLPFPPEGRVHEA